MFLASAVANSVKKREVLNDDDVLEDLMSEIKNDSAQKSTVSVLREKQ